MTRRTVEIGFTSIDGIRTDGKHHIALLTINGDSVEVHVSQSMVGIVKEIYGQRARLQLVVDDFNPNGGHWRESNRAYFQPDEMVGRRATPEPEPEQHEDLSGGGIATDRLLLAKALDRARGVKAAVGPAAGLSKTAYHCVMERFKQGKAMTTRTREALLKFVARGDGR